MNRFFLTPWVIVSVFGSLAALADPGDNNPAAKDHPLIRRYPGSRILEQTQFEFDETSIVEGREPKGTFKTRMVSGKWTFTLYGIPQGRSVVEVYTNIEEALTKQGFKSQFQASAAEIRAANHASKKAMHLKTGCKAFYVRNDANGKLLTALKTNGSQKIWAQVLVQDEEYGCYGARQLSYISIVEEKPMQTGLIVVSASEIEKSLGQQGKVELRAVHFETGSDVIKPESDPQLEQMAQFLKTTSYRGLYVVGHTDDQGALESNLLLSQNRAQRVFEALTRRGVNMDKLTARGAGPLAPVGSNLTDEGRAQNRRVELVVKFQK